MRYNREKSKKGSLLVGHSFIYTGGIDCNESGSTSCGDGECDGGICRCYTIEDAWVTDLDFDLVKKEVVNALGFNDDTKQKRREKKLDSLLHNGSSYLDDYCIDRICRSEKLWDKNTWDVAYSGNYYGDEVDGIFLEDNTARKVEEEIRTLVGYRNIEDRVYHLLMREYNSVLNELTEKIFDIDIVETSKIKLGQTNHAKNLLPMDLEHYSDSNYNGIRGIVIDKGHYYQLIDGYHRMTATNQSHVEVIVAKDVY